MVEHALRFGDDGLVVTPTSNDLAARTRSDPRTVPPFEDRRRALEVWPIDLDRWNHGSSSGV